MLAVTAYCASVPEQGSKCAIVCGLRLTGRFPQLNSNGNYRVSALVQVNNEQMPIGSLRKFEEIESMLEFEDSRVYLSEKTVICIVIASGRSNLEINFVYCNGRFCCVVLTNIFIKGWVTIAQSE
jgi:hypothetical protein